MESATILMAPTTGLSGHSKKTILLACVKLPHGLKDLCFVYFLSGHLRQVSLYFKLLMSSDLIPNCLQRLSANIFYTPPHFSVGVLCYTFRCLSVRPCSPFPIDNLSIYSRNCFKFCIHIVIGDEWYGIVNGQNPSIFNGVTALFRIGKMVSGLSFLYCS